MTKDFSLVRKLRESSGCGISDCNKALAENNNDFEAAVDWLRKKGLSSAAKKADRVTAEGVVAVNIQGNKACVVEINSETDFVARNQQFQDLVNSLVKEAIEFGSDVEAFKVAKDAELKSQIGVIGENINIRRLDSLVINKGKIVSYVHNAIAPNMGKIAVLIALESSSSQDKLEEIGKQIAMHVAAAKPDALSIELIDQAKLARETAILKEQAISSGKPESIVEKMLEGRIRKYYEESVLLEQIFVMDGETRIKDLLAKFSKDNGETKLVGFKIFVLGDGIEKKESNFAQEVSSIIS